MKKHNEIERVCAFCEHLQYVYPTQDKKSKQIPITYLSYLRLASGEEEATLYCKHKKCVSLDGSCRHFCYDLLKRIPRQKNEMPTLDPESLLDPT